MAKGNVLTKLRKMGYSRYEDFVAPLQRETTPPEPMQLKSQCYKGKILNHTIMENITLIDCNYEGACVTGSIFRNCKFINCSMDQADFEFCEFYNCEFETKQIYGCSFNSSSFVDTIFSSVSFESCTFTGVLFQKCSLSGVKIICSTLENAIYKQCSFFHMDLRCLNMDYIDFENPYMEDVTLPISQVTFMFGALQYLKNTKDAVFISKGNQGRMTPDEFFQEVAPLLCKHFSKTRQFFPLANIYLATGKLSEGRASVRQGVLAAMALKDFRMLKHFCKLTAYSNAFDSKALRDLYYNYICRIFPQQNGEIGVPNYTRHIMDIKGLLLSRIKSPNTSIVFETDIQQGESKKVGTLMDWIFSLAKRVGRFENGDIDVVLSYHSPLSVTIRLCGEEKPLAELMSAYFALAGLGHREMATLPVVSDFLRTLPQHTGEQQQQEELVRTCREELGVLSIHLSLLEFYIENFQVYSPNCETGYYFNSKAVSGRAMLT